MNYNKAYLWVMQTNFLGIAWLVINVPEVFMQSVALAILSVQALIISIFATYRNDFRDFYGLPKEINTKFFIALGVAIGFSALLGFLIQVALSVYPILIMLAVVPEEFTFRAALLPSIKNTLTENKVNEYFASAIAVLITSSSWAIFHYLVYNISTAMLMIFVIGVIFGIADVVAESSVPSLIAHFLINATQAVRYLLI